MADPKPPATYAIKRYVKHGDPEPDFIEQMKCETLRHVAGGMDLGKTYEIKFAPIEREPESRNEKWIDPPNGRFIILRTTVKEL